MKKLSIYLFFYAVAVRGQRAHNDLAAVLRVLTLESLDPEEFAQVCFVFLFF